jgi:dsDNA-specific endonuclease/ATPase MutS2
VSDKPVHIALDGVLDLHTFRPEDILDVVQEYLEACHEQGIRHIRIIHGKGKGVQRSAVRKLLEEHHLVVSFSDAEVTAGGWGATIVELMPAVKE